MSSDRVRQAMLQNAEEIKRLSARIDETVQHRSESREKHREWESACAEFHERYRTLAFPGGYDGALGRIVAGDEEAMEAAICFLECRPYFFRSGYMFKEILREAKRAPQIKGKAFAIYWSWDGDRHWLRWARLGRAIA